MEETVGVWPKQEKVVRCGNRSSRQAEMFEYAKNIGKDTKSARAYLRSVGLDISNKGEICNAK